MRKILTKLAALAGRIPLTGALCAVASLAALALPASPVHAQGLFSPAITVNGRVITQFELEQRTQLLRILNAPGDPAKLAREGLIEDRLKQQEIDAIALEIPPEDVENGIVQFAARANLPPDELIKALEQNGVSRETLRDFVKMQIAWREFVGTRFGNRARPSESEINRALGQGGAGTGIQVLLSELIIPVTPQTLDQVEALADEISKVTSYDAFSAAATQYSASDTRNNGGRMNWLPISNLPPALQPVILALNPGEVTAPLSLPNAVALFQMRGIRESGTSAPRYASIEYAAYYIAGGRSPEALSTAAGIANRVDTCNDLYGIAKGQPETVLDRETKKPGEIPRDIALELAKLDPGEISTALTRSSGQTLVFLMLCGRTSEFAEDASRQDIANALIDQRLNAISKSYLEQLKADSVIIEK